LLGQNIVVEADNAFADLVEGERLFKLLDGLPLAIAQAGAYLQESGTGLRTYLKFYEQQWKELMESRELADVPLQDYDYSVWTTWAISYTAVREKHKATANLLLLWSFLDNGDLWHGLFAAACRASTVAARGLLEWIGDMASNKLEFVNAMRLLRNYSLIEDVPGVESYVTHPVVHKWAYHYQGKHFESKLARLAVVVVGWAVPRSLTRDSSAIQRRLLPHAQVCFQRVLVSAGETGRRPKSHNGDVDFDESEEKEGILGAIHGLGLLYADQAKLAEAETMYQQALTSKEKALGPEHTSTLNTVNTLGNLYVNQGKLAEAETIYQRALTGYEKALGPEHTLTLGTVNNLGLLYVNQGKLAEAETMYQRALTGYEKALGPEHISTLSIVGNLGNLYAKQGKLAEAETMFQRALTGKEKALGPEHTSTLSTVNNLGLLYVNQGKLAEAETMYQQALTGYEKALEPEHTSTLSIVGNLGNLYAKQGKLAEAETMYQRALTGKEKALGLEHTSTLNTVGNLGNLYKNQGKLAEAETMYQRALQGFEKALDVDNATTYIPALHTIRALGSLFERQADLAKARIMYSKALVGFEKVVGRDHSSSQRLRDKLRALDTVTENKASNTHEREPGEQISEETSHLGAEGTLSKSKRHKLLKKLCLR
jgi:tetratricopeptide (TPR) repeat protein